MGFCSCPLHVLAVEPVTCPLLRLSLLVYKRDHPDKIMLCKGFFKNIIVCLYINVRDCYQSSLLHTDVVYDQIRMTFNTLP